MEDFYSKEISGNSATVQSDQTGQDFYSKEIGNQQTPDTTNYSNLINKDEQAAPINLGQAMNIGSIRTPEYKAKYVKGLFAGSDVAIQPDNRIKVTSPQGSEMFIEPHRHGFINAIKDNATKLAEFVGDQGLPIAGQMAADATAVSSGAGMAGLIGANAAGAAAGRGVQQAYNNQISGEPYSAGDVALQGVAGGMAPPIAAAVEPVLKSAAGALSRGVSKLVNALGNAAPSVSESLFGVPHMNTEWLVDQMRAGRSAADVFGKNLSNASPERGGQIVRNLLFGDANPKNSTPENFIKQYQRLHAPIAGDAGKVGVLDDFFSKSLGLDKDTLDVLKTKSAGELLSPSVTDPKAWRTLADNAVSSIQSAQNDLQTQYGAVLKSVIEKTNDKTLNVRPFVDELKNELQKLRIVDGLTLNKNYNGEAAKKAYQTVLGKFGDILSRDEKLIPLGGGGSGRARGKGFTAGDLQDLINRGVETTINGKNVKMTAFDVANMRLSDIRNIKAETKPLFNKLFEGTGLSQEEKRPLAQFLNRLDGAIQNVKGTEPLTAINQKYAKFQDAKDLFHTLGYGGLSEQQGVISTLKQSLATDPATRATNQSYLGDLDTMLKNKILPQVKALGASQDARFADYNGTEKKLIGQMRAIHQSGASQDMQRQAADILKTVDNAIPQKQYKFYNDMRDHLTAESYSSNRQNVFKVRYLETLLGASALTAGHPILGAAGVLGGLNAFSPAGVGRFVMGGEKLLNGTAGTGANIAKSAGNVAMSSGAKAALASILRKKTGI